MGKIHCDPMYFTHSCGQSDAGELAGHVVRYSARSDVNAQLASMAQANAAAFIQDRRQETYVLFFFNVFIVFSLVC